MAVTMAKQFSAANGKSLRGAIHCALATLAVSSSVVMPTAHAAEWRFAPTLLTSESYTDNLRLAPDNKKESSFITELSPGLSIASYGPRLKLNAVYTMQNSYYSAPHIGLKTSHLLNAAINANLVENLFFLDGNARVSQQNIGPFQPEVVNNSSLSADRTEVKTYSISPYLRKNFANEFTAEARYTHDSLTTSSNAFANSTSDIALLKINSGNNFSRFAWGFEYRDETAHLTEQSAQQSDLTLRKAVGNVGYALSREFKLTSSVGYEDNNYVFIGKKPNGGLWTAGFIWTPSERTNLHLSAGHRFYGNTYKAAFDHRARNSVWVLSYDDDIVPSRSQFTIPATNSTSGLLNQLFISTVPDLALRQQVVNKFIADNRLPDALAHSVNTAANRVYLQKNFLASVGIIGVRNNLLFSLFDTRRQAVSQGGVDAIFLGANNPALLDDTKQLGVTAFLNSQLSARTSASINASYARSTSVSTGIEDNNKFVRVAIDRQLQRKLRASVEIRRNARDSMINTNDYTENSVMFSVLFGL